MQVTMPDEIADALAGTFPVAVVHLVRQGNPDVFLNRFLDSYAAHPAGTPHQLVFVLKGFSVDGAGAVRARIERAAERPLFIEINDDGFDIGAYRHAAQSIECEFAVFLNSHSEIESDNWLAKLMSAFERRADTGIAGATGNWESLDERTSFPNIHIRTNAFAIRRRDFLSLEFGSLTSKFANNEFEAGARSMTGQLIERGLEPYVVGRDGAIFDRHSWPASRTFRSGSQENLLVCDNRTRDFTQGSPRHRMKVARLSWGESAHVTPLSPLQRVRVFFGRLTKGRL